MKKIILTGFLILFAFAQEKIITGNDYYLKIRNQTQKNFSINSGNEGVIKDKKQTFDPFLDTTILTDIETNNPPHNVAYALNAKYLNNNVKLYRKLNFNTKNNLKKPKKIILNVKGYCRVLHNVKVYFSDEFSQAQCDLVNIKNNIALKAKVFIKFVPDYKREILIAFPVYAEINSKRLNAVGYFLNATKTSLNVADRVDGVRIKKLLLKGLLVESDIAYNQAMMYLNDLRASRTQTSVTYITDNNGNSTPVQSQTTQKPKARDYINTGIVQSIASLIKLLGENSLYELKPLFYVNQGSIFYTEMILENNNVFNKMQDIMKEKENQIQKNNNDYYKDLMTIPKAVSTK